MGLGRYRPHAFFITIRPNANLHLEAVEDPRIEADVPFDCAVPTHVHEYIHFLHNISTVSGLNSFRANLWLVALLRHCTDFEGRVVRELPHQENLQNRLKVAAEWKDLLYGSVRWNDDPPSQNVEKWIFGSVHRQVWNVSLSSESYSIEQVAIDLEAKTREGRVSGRLNIGYDFITEGVAYEVERQLYVANGKPRCVIDATIPAYPYLTYEALIDHLVGRQTTVNERIQLGVCSLMCASPSSGLFALAEQLRQQEDSMPQLKGLPHSIVDSVFRAFKVDPLATLVSINDDLVNIFTGDLAYGAATDISALLRAGLALRGVNYFLESTFLGLSFDRDRFLYHIGTLLPDCCIRQEKSDGTAELRWVGPGIVGVDSQSRDHIGILQAAIHYATRHLHKNKFLLTDELPEISCPFSGACQAEEQDGKPIECKARPWERFRSTPNGQPKCWYATAVDLFRSGESMATETEVAIGDCVR